MHLPGTSGLAFAALAFSVATVAASSDSTPDKQCVEKDISPSCVAASAPAARPDECAGTGGQGSKEIRTKGSVRVSASQSGQTLRQAGDGSAPEISATPAATGKYSAPINISTRATAACARSPAN